MKDNERKTALIYATIAGQTASVEDLLENGADFNISDNNKDTALKWAEKKGYTEIIRFLKETDVYSSFKKN